VLFFFVVLFSSVYFPFSICIYGIMASIIYSWPGNSKKKKSKSQFSANRIIMSGEEYNNNNKNITDDISGERNQRKNCNDFCLDHMNGIDDDGADVGGGGGKTKSKTIEKLIIFSILFFCSVILISCSWHARFFISKRIFA
jgi:hypothetical protein